MQIDNSTNSVLITGGTQGLGYAIAKDLIENGCKELIIAGRNPQKGVKAEKSLRETGSNVKYLKTDLADVTDCSHLISKSIKLFPNLNSLVNSAAITTRGSIEDTSLKLWEEHINTNLRAPFLLMQVNPFL